MRIMARRQMSRQPKVHTNLSMEVKIYQLLRVMSEDDETTASGLMSTLIRNEAIKRGLIKP